TLPHQGGGNFLVLPHQGGRKIVLFPANEDGSLFPLPWWERVRVRGLALSNILIISKDAFWKYLAKKSTDS
ncbi:MAG: hypothetical protein AAB296_05075, partial [Candidatus Desantisbacteria bacterium]